MREALFIKKNMEKWTKFQKELPADANETAEQFVVLIDDLSYAKTFYPRSKVTEWINGLAAKIYQSIYQNKKEKYSRFFDFWKYELPLLFRQYHRVFLFTSVLFISFMLIGVFSSIHNPDFIRGVLGERYVHMTEQNIADGDPFGVYKDSNPFSMFVRIAFNNIRVAFLSFISGLTLGIFTLKILWSNGIMVGSFQYLFFAHDLGWKSVMVIWIHGTIEISSIIIAATAGFVLAKGILFPKTFTRYHSFKMHAKDALKILLSLIPFFVIAAFFESYLTHRMSTTFDSSAASGMPVWVSALILFFSLLLILWYFVFWPIYLHKNGIQSRKGNVVNQITPADA